MPYQVNLHDHVPSCMRFILTIWVTNLQLVRSMTGTFNINEAQDGFEKESERFDIINNFSLRTRFNFTRYNVR